MEFLELIKVTFISFTVFMAIVITVSYTVYKVKKKNQPTKQAVVPQIITSKKVEQKQVVTLPPPKPVPMKVKVPAPGNPQSSNRLQQMPPTNRDGSFSQRTNDVSRSGQPINYEKLVYQQGNTNPNINQQSAQYTQSSQSFNMENTPTSRNADGRTYGGSQETSRFMTDQTAVGARRSGQVGDERYPNMSVVGGAENRQTNPKYSNVSPQERFQVMNRPDDAVKTSSGIAYYGSERLSYQPPSYLKIVPPKPQDSFRNKYSGS